MSLESIQVVLEDLPGYEPDYVYFLIDRKDTNYVNRILEGYEHIGVMTTVDGSLGLCMVRSTSDTKALVQEVLGSLTIPLRLL